MGVESNSAFMDLSFMSGDLEEFDFEKTFSAPEERTERHYLILQSVGKELAGRNTKLERQLHQAENECEELSTIKRALGEHLSCTREEILECQKEAEDQIEALKAEVKDEKDRIQRMKASGGRQERERSLAFDQLVKQNERLTQEVHKVLETDKKLRAELKTAQSNVRDQKTLLQQRQSKLDSLEEEKAKLYNQNSSLLHRLAVASNGREEVSAQKEQLFSKVRTLERQNSRIEAKLLSKEKEVREMGEELGEYKAKTKEMCEVFGGGAKDLERPGSVASGGPTSSGIGEDFEFSPKSITSGYNSNMSLLDELAGEEGMEGLFAVDSFSQLRVESREIYGELRAAITELESITQAAMSPSAMTSSSSSSLRSVSPSFSLSSPSPAEQLSPIHISISTRHPGTSSLPGSACDPSLSPESASSSVSPQSSSSSCPSSSSPSITSPVPSSHQAVSLGTSTPYNASASSTAVGSSSSQLIATPSNSSAQGSVTPLPHNTNVESGDVLALARQIRRLASGLNGVTMVMREESDARLNEVTMLQCRVDELESQCKNHAEEVARLKRNSSEDSERRYESGADDALGEGSGEDATLRSRCEGAEEELALARHALVKLEKELFETIRIKAGLSEQLELWQIDMEEMIRTQVKERLQKETEARRTKNSSNASIRKKASGPFSAFINRLR